MICRRNEIALCAKLLGLSAEALSDNPGVMFFVLAAQVGEFCCAINEFSCMTLCAGAHVIDNIFTCLRITWHCCCRGSNDLLLQSCSW